MTRVVTAGIGFEYRYRARIVESETFWRKRKGWRYRIERHWVVWRPHLTSRWYASREKCEAAANAWLDDVSEVRGEVL